jgi:hypothetical protein
MSLRKNPLWRRAQILLVLAKTDPAAQPAHRE